MTKGPRELVVAQLVTAGFTPAQASSLVGEWTTMLRPELMTIFSLMAKAIYDRVEHGAPLTYETTLQELRRIRQMYQGAQEPQELQGVDVSKVYF
jgi:hypothetical protein